MKWELSLIPVVAMNAGYVSIRMMKILILIEMHQTTSLRSRWRCQNAYMDQSEKIKVSRQNHKFFIFPI